VAAPGRVVLDSPTAGPTALRMGAYPGGVLLSLVSVPPLIRHLGISSFGDSAAVLSLVTMVGGLNVASLNAIAVRENTTAPATGRPALMANVLGTGLVSLVGAVAFATAADSDEALVWGTVLAGLGLLVILTPSLLTLPLPFKVRQGLVSVLEFLRQLVGSLLSVALVPEDEDALNMASAERRPIRGLAVALAEAAGRADLPRTWARPSNTSEPASIHTAIERLRDAVGWRGGRTLEQGAAGTIAWWRQAAPAP
jgi:hypothetical protein